MKAVVMAGGFGLRLHPLTFGCPKVMVSFVNKPVLAHVLDYLKRHDFTEVIITVQFMADQIQAYFGDGRAFGLDIHYAVEKTRLGSAGGVKNAESLLNDETFVVISGDTITDIDLFDLIEFHQQKKAMATMALCQVDDPRPFGVITINGAGLLTQYDEKPSQISSKNNWVNTGLYVMEPAILQRMKPQVVYDFAYGIFPKMIEEGAPLYGYRTIGYWADIGSGIPAYKKATTAALMEQIQSLNLGNQIGKHIWSGQNLQIAPSATLSGPIYLGDDVIIRDEAEIIGPTIVGNNTLIDRAAKVEQSIIGRSCYISESAHIHNVIMPGELA